MNKEELCEVTEIILDSIITSELNNYIKIEMMINIKKFLENYEENIKILREVEKGKKYESKI